MLQATGLPQYQVQISQTNLERWDVVGTLRGVQIRVNSDTAGATSPDNVAPPTDGDDTVASSGVADPLENCVRDEGDIGPAPLQNDHLPDHVFQGTDGHQGAVIDPLLSLNAAFSELQ